MSVRTLEAVRPSTRIEQTAERERWGQFPLFSVIGAVGLFLVAFAYKGGREQASWASALYWVGIMVTFLPITLRLFSPAPKRRERLALVIVLVLLLYFVKYTYSPLEFKFSDELQHWRGTANMLDASHLFQMNSSLPIDTVFPGLQIITDALIKIGGQPIFDAGIPVMGAARLLMAGALFLFYERVSRSAHLAGIACVLYMTNPHFMFINAMYTYQIAIVFMILAFAIIAFAEHAGRLRSRYLLLLIPVFVAMAITHHLTSYIFVGLLLLWTVIAYFVRRSNPDQRIPWKITLLAVVIVAIWFVQAASLTVPYLEPNIVNLVNNFTTLLSRSSEVETVFHPPDSPLLERLINYGSVGIIGLCLPFGLWAIWKKFRHNALALMLGVGSLSFGVSLGVRLVSSDGAELAGRSWIFVFFVVSFALAAGFVYFGQRLPRARIFSVVGPAVAVILFLGGITGGWPPYWERLPGPYQVAASEASMDPEGQAASDWAPVYLGIQNRILADLSNYLFMGAYGNQNPIYSNSDAVMSPTLSATQIASLKFGEIHYILVDQRLSTSLPVRGYYFNDREANAYDYSRPVDPAALAKFDTLPAVNRIFDSGNIVLYDVSQFLAQH